jgi:oxygen-independent coproporphyrinogen-3 oxidase
MNRPCELALYLHIPFCAARCAYCDFNTYAGLETFFEPYVSALALETRRAGEAAGHPSAPTLFIGGGTPTVLPVPLLAQVLEACFDAFELDAHAEITCEANPGTADQAHFAALRSPGINRLSLGVQSFDDAELRWLGRIHSAREVERAFSAARSAGFDNINLDLIFGFPGHEQASWRRTLNRALALGPEHLSLYSLTVEPNTPLGRQVRRGLVSHPDDDLAADLYQLACDLLARHGYVHYEISSWARGTHLQVDRDPAGQVSATQARAIDHETRMLSAGSPSMSAIQLPASPRPHPGFCPSRPSRPRRTGRGDRDSFLYCRHNLVYWRGEPYLGFGAGAHSYHGARRWWNVKSVPRYIARVEAGGAPRAGGERIGTRLAMAETMMLGLRLLQEGVPGERFRTRFGIGIEEAFGAEIDGLVARGLLERLPDRVRLTPNGWLLGNRVFAEFMPP